MRIRTRLMVLAVAVIAVGAASGHAAGPSDACPPGTANVDSCQVAPAECMSGKGVTEIGTAADDLQVGSNCADTQRGGSGNDTERGRGGDDKQDGGTGNDTIDGGDGKDHQSGA